VRRVFQRLQPKPEEKRSGSKPAPRLTAEQLEEKEARTELADVALADVCWVLAFAIAANLLHVDVWPSLTDDMLKSAAGCTAALAAVLGFVMVPNWGPAPAQTQTLWLPYIDDANAAFPSVEAPVQPGDFKEEEKGLEARVEGMVNEAWSHVDFSRYKTQKELEEQYWKQVRAAKKREKMRLSALVSRSNAPAEDDSASAFETWQRGAGPREQQVHDFQEFVVRFSDAAPAAPASEAPSATDDWPAGIKSLDMAVLALCAMGIAQQCYLAVPLIIANRRSAAWHGSPNRPAASDADAPADAAGAGAGAREVAGAARGEAGAPVSTRAATLAALEAFGVVEAAAEAPAEPIVADDKAQRVHAWRALQRRKAALRECFLTRWRETLQRNFDTFMAQDGARAAFDDADMAEMAEVYVRKTMGQWGVAVLPLTAEQAAREWPLADWELWRHPARQLAACQVALWDQIPISSASPRTLWYKACCRS
jgi:hypothetical protein